MELVEEARTVGAGWQDTVAGGEVLTLHVPQREDNIGRRGGAIDGSDAGIDIDGSGAKMRGAGRDA